MFECLLHVQPWIIVTVAINTIDPKGIIFQYLMVGILNFCQ